MTVTFSGPRLDTERLTLRVPHPSDFPAFEAFQTSARAADRGWQMEPAALERFWHSQFGHWITHGFGWFVMERKTDAAPLGYVGLVHTQDRPEPETGWTIWRDDAVGQGYAFEAARAVLSFAFDTLGHDSVPAYVGKTNARSRSLAQRLGAVADGEWTTPAGDIEDIWRIRRPA